MSLPPIIHSGRIDPARTGPAASSDAPQDGASFADLLASLLWERGADAGPAGDRDRPEVQLAELFNERGFFADAPGSLVTTLLADAARAAANDRFASGASIAAPASAAAAAAAAREASTNAALAPPPGPPPDAAATGSPPAGAPNPAMRPVKARTEALSAPESRARAGAPVATGRLAAVRTGGSDQAIVRQPPARPAPKPATAGATTDTRLNLQAADAQASLVARVAALTREERARLRSEIAGLLAAHGLNLGSLRLNGEIEPASSSQGKEG